MNNLVIVKFQITMHLKILKEQNRKASSWDYHYTQWVTCSDKMKLNKSARIFFYLLPFSKRDKNSRSSTGMLCMLRKDAQPHKQSEPNRYHVISHTSRDGANAEAQPQSRTTQHYLSQSKVQTVCEPEAAFPGIDQRITAYAQKEACTKIIPEALCKLQKYEKHLKYMLIRESIHFEAFI